MAFVCTIDDVFEINISKEGNASVAAVAVGYDSEKNFDYTVMLGFSPGG